MHCKCVCIICTIQMWPCTMWQCNLSNYLEGGLWLVIKYVPLLYCYCLLYFCFSSAMNLHTNRKQVATLFRWFASWVWYGTMVSYFTPSSLLYSTYTWIVHIKSLFCSILPVAQTGFANGKRERELLESTEHLMWKWSLSSIQLAFRKHGIEDHWHAWKSCVIVLLIIALSLAE